MSATINSPRGGDTVNSLTISASVSYDTSIGVKRKKDDKDDKDGKDGKDGVGDSITWRLTCWIDDEDSQTSTVADGQGTVSFSLSVSGTGDYTLQAKLEKVITSGGTTTVEQHGSDSQSPIHVSDGTGGIIIIVIGPPPPPPPPMPPGPPGPPVAAKAAADSGSVEAAARKLAAAAVAAVQPVILSGQIALNPAVPATGIVCEIYHVNAVTKVVTVDYVAVAQFLGEDWVVVIDPAARGGNRQFRLYLIGVLGQIIVTVSGPVP